MRRTTLVSAVSLLGGLLLAANAGCPYAQRSRPTPTDAGVRTDATLCTDATLHTDATL